MIHPKLPLKLVKTSHASYSGPKYDLYIISISFGEIWSTWGWIVRFTQKWLKLHKNLWASYLWPKYIVEKFLSDLVHLEVNRTIHPKLLRIGQKVRGRVPVTSGGSNRSFVSFGSFLDELHNSPKTHQNWSKFLKQATPDMYMTCRCHTQNLIKFGPL